MKRKKSLGTQIESVSGGMLVLTPREKRLLRRFAQGKTDKTIAQEIGDTEERIAAQRQGSPKNFKFGRQMSLWRWLSGSLLCPNDRREVGRADAGGPQPRSARCARNTDIDWDRPNARLVIKLL